MPKLALPRASLASLGNTPLNCIPIRPNLILFGIIIEYYNCVHNILSGITTIVLPIFDTHVIICSIEFKLKIIIKKNFMYTNLKIEQAALRCGISI